jgi:hypothetical protein
VVEHQLPKLRVGGSIPLSRSQKFKELVYSDSFFYMLFTPDIRLCELESNKFYLEKHLLSDSFVPI